MIFSKPMVKPTLPIYERKETMCKYCDKAKTYRVKVRIAIPVRTRCGWWLFQNETFYVDTLANVISEISLIASRGTIDNIVIERL